jgi:tetratricopeptide (TPR) repeat protein
MPLFQKLITAASIAGMLCCSLTPAGREAKHMAKGKEYLAKKDYKRAAIEFKVASQNAQKDAEPHYQLGLVYVGAKTVQPAIAEFRKTLELNPKHADADYQLARLEVSSNVKSDVGKAESVLSRFSKAHPNDAEAAAALAVAQTKLGMTSEALVNLDRAVTLNPSDVNPVAAVIVMQLGRNDVATAKEIAVKAAARLPKSPEAALLLGKVLLVAGERAPAEAEIARALSLDPKFRPALELRLSLLTGDKKSVDAEETARILSTLPDKGMLSAYPNYLLREGKVEPALQEFRRLIREHPDDAGLRDQFAAILLGMNRREEAGTVVTSALEKSAKDPDAMLIEASIKIDTGDLAQAEKLLNAVDVAKPNSAAAKYQRSRIYAFRGESRKQGDLLVEALQRNRNLFPARLELARLLTDAGNPQRALQLLDSASQTEQKTGLYHYFRSGALMAEQNWEEARKEVAVGLTAGRTAPLLDQDALLKMQAKDLPGAKKSLEESLKTDPKSVATIGLLGNVYHQMKEDAQFLVLLRQLVAANSSAPQLQQALGVQLLSTGDKAGARAAFEAAKADDPTFVAADELLARMDVEENGLDRARQRLLGAVKTHDTAGARDMLGAIEERQKDWEKAAQHYRKALDLSPSDGVALNNLANVLSEHLGKPDEALTYAEKAKALHPTDPFIEDTIGCIYLKKKNLPSALAHLQTSAKTYDRATVHYHLALAYAQSGDRPRANQEYQVALKMDPKSPERSMAEGQLSLIK